MGHLEEKQLALVVAGMTQTKVQDSYAVRRDLDLVEYGAGLATMTSVAKRRGWKAEPMDILYSEGDDFRTPQGQAKARSLALRLKPGGCQLTLER